jgi:acyl CoA:acetate/3-ketoacid CoA transferase beta subunit
MSNETTTPRWQHCAIAIAEAYRGNGEIVASPMGTLPAIGARLAKLTFEPGLLLSDGVATFMADTPALGGEADATAEGWFPYRQVFDVVFSGRRHVMMGASQIDRFGNQNISCLGDWKQPKVQLLGVRGAPGNTINHATSYWIAKHSRRVFVEKVDVVSGVGYDRAAELGEQAARFHSIPRVITNLGVFDFETPERKMRIASVHPGSSVAEVVENTGFELVIPNDVPETRAPSADESALLAKLDPRGWGAKEVPEQPAA